MERYINANWIYQMVEDRYMVSSGIEHRCERDLLDLICQAPTADVAPKSEVAREIFEELHQKRNELWNKGKYTMFETWCKAEEELKKKYTEDKT